MSAAIVAERLRMKLASSPFFSYSALFFSGYAGTPPTLSSTVAWD
jgi:hypothetical protein